MARGGPCLSLSTPSSLGDLIRSYNPNTLRELVPATFMGPVQNSPLNSVHSFNKHTLNLFSIPGTPFQTGGPSVTGEYNPLPCPLSTPTRPACPAPRKRLPVPLTLDSDFTALPPHLPLPLHALPPSTPEAELKTRVSSLTPLSHTLIHSLPHSFPHVKSLPNAHIASWGTNSEPGRQTPALAELTF